jgi:hypothetical protein
LYSSSLAGQATAYKDRAIRLNSSSFSSSKEPKEAPYEKGVIIRVGITTSFLYFSQSFLTVARIGLAYRFG